jgi:hypothetical protein
MKYLTGKIIFYHHPVVGPEVDTKPRELLLLCHFLASDLRNVSGIDYYLPSIKHYINNNEFHEGGIAQNTGVLILNKHTATFAEDFIEVNEEQDFVVETDLLFEIIKRWRQFLLEKGKDDVEIDVEELRSSLKSKSE